jgi:hypothetical protein
MVLGKPASHSHPNQAGSTQQEHRRIANLHDAQRSRMSASMISRS